MALFGHETETYRNMLQQLVSAASAIFASLKAPKFASSTSPLVNRLLAMKNRRTWED
jgi:hypothetical protein